ncbi:hypothetical protein LINPERPRIM_LOCUS23008 [Linum perenne]
MYAGSAFAVSPSPSALPLPSFSKKKQVSVDDSATRDLRRLLRLDFRSQQATEPQSQQPSISGFPIVTGDGTPPTTRGLTWYPISFFPETDSLSCCSYCVLPTAGTYFCSK